MQNTKPFDKVKERSRFLTRTRMLTIAVSFLSLFAHSQTPQLLVSADWETTSATQNTFQRSVVRTASLGGSIYTYVCGATLSASGDYDMLVERFSPGGNLLWAQTYDYAGGNDVATDVRIATNGEVYICGTYYKDATDSSNAIVIKYDPNGNFRWANTYNGGGSRNDGYSALLQSGAVVVAVGSGWSASNQYDMVVRRIDTAGTTAWTTTYDNSNLNDAAVNLTSRSGSIFVTGASETVANTTYKIATLKINPSTGAITSTTLSSGMGFGIDKVTDIQEDASGNVYITGTVYNGFSTLYDIHTVKYDNSLSQVWSVDYNGASNLDDVGTSLFLDSLDNVIVTGYTNTTTQGKNYITIKYNSSGTQQWATSMNGAANGLDSATGVVAQGTDIYVTGMSYNGTNYDYRTVKYNSSGTQQWAINWNSPINSNDIPTAIATDTARAIIVTGQTSGSSNYTTVRYVERSVLTPTDSEPLGGAFQFTENRGQLRTVDDKPTTVKYYNNSGGDNQEVYFSDDRLTYVWAKLDTSHTTTTPADTTFRVDMKFKNGNVANINAKDERSNYENFFYSWCPEGCRKVKTYDRLYRTDIYTDIDVMYSSSGTGMKYYYMVKVGGDPTDIQEVYSGADSVRVNGSGDLVVYTYLGNLQHPKATVWEIDGSGTANALAWNPTYSVSGDTVSFGSFGSYDVTKTLIIEVSNGATSTPANNPSDNLEWSTHYGSHAGGINNQQSPTQFNTVRADKAENSFYAGLTNGHNFPVLNGIHATNSGSYDFTLVKIDSTAKRRWATYYGGTGSETFPFMDMDTTANIYFCGATASTNIPMAPSQPAGAFVDPSANGSNDLFVMKMDSTGGANITGVLWTTYYGGANSDRPNGIIVSPSGDRVDVFGIPGTGFPLVNRTNAYNTSTGNNFILEFSPQYDTLWCTRFASAGYINDMANDNYGNIYAVGNASSTGNLPMYDAGNGNYYDSNAGNDAFIVRFNSDDTVRWCTGFGGTGGDAASAVIATTKGIYVAGYESSPDTTFPLMFSAGEYIDSVRFVSNPDAWIARFNISNNALKWCSLWGGNGMEIAYDLAADDNDNVYLYGITDGPGDYIYATGNAYSQSLSASSQDAFIAGFSTANQCTWSTCFGGNKAETGVSLSASGHSKLFVTGWSQSSDVYSNPNHYPWDYPNANAFIDTLKTNDSAQTGFMARFDLQSVTVGINEVYAQQNGNMLIYPNPTGGNLTVQVSDLKGEDVRIVVFDLLGQSVIDRKKGENYGTLQESLDLSNLSNGVYLVMVQVGNRSVMTQKVIKQQ